MMDRLREGVNSIFIKVILGLIMISFVFAGVGSYLTGGNQQYAAKVGDSEISLGQLEKAYQEERNKIQNSDMGAYFNALLADPNYQRQFKNSILARLVNNRLLDVHAIDIGMAASDEQIKQYIRNIPQFNQDGKFDNEKYLTAITRIGYSPEQFAQSLRGDIVRQQLVNAIQGTDFVLEDEMNDVYQLQAQKRQIRSYILKTDDFAQSVELTQEDVQKYYDEHSDQFMQPEQVKIDYVQLSAPILKEKLGLSDEDAEDEFYKLQSKLADKAFEFPDTLDDAAQAVGLNVMTSDFISPETATGVLADSKIMQTAYSEEVKDEGLNSEVIQLSDTDIIVIRVQDTKPATLKAFDTVKTQVEDILTQAEAQQAAKAKADELLVALKAGDASQVAFGDEQEIIRNIPDAQLANAVFSLAKPVDGKPQYTLIQNAQGEMQIIALDAVISPDALTDEQRAVYSDNYAKYQAQNIMQTSVATLAEIIDVTYSAQVQ